MVDFYAVTSSPLPKRLHGRDAAFSIRLLSQAERLAIEDRFFKDGIKIALNREATAVVLSQSLTERNGIDECATLAEFALAILTVSGFQPVSVAAFFTGGSCMRALQRSYRQNYAAQPVFARSINGTAASRWLRQFFEARGNIPDRMHITAARFVRYLRAQNVGDSLMDLCISLESLLDSQTEVSFRFATCLAKVTGNTGKEAEETADLLSALYDLRSKIVHGDPAATKLLGKIQPSLPALRKIARTVLTKYVLFMSEHLRGDWRQHLRSSLFA